MKYLATVTRVVSRFPRSPCVSQSRTLGTLPSASDKSTMVDTTGTLESFIPGAFEAVAASKPKTPAPAPIPSSTPVQMDIPPPEDPLLHYLTSALQHHGHRAKAARMTSLTLLHIHAFTRAPPLPILREAIMAAAPAVRCMSHKHGSKNVAKPIALGEKQRVRTAVHMIIKASEKKNGKTIAERLAREMIAVVQGDSRALEERETIHRFAMVNRGNTLLR